MDNIHNQILKIKAEQPLLGYKSIAKLVGCSKNTVKYHLTPQYRRLVYQNAKQYRKLNPLCAKLGHFREIREKKKNFDKMNNKRRCKATSQFTTKDLLLKFGEHPVCHLSGVTIDLDAINTYEFDHIIPVSKGGDNSLGNLGLCNKDINRAKCDKTISEFLLLCRKVLEHNGYQVSKLGCVTNPAIVPQTSQI